MRTVVISDLHLGEAAGGDLLRLQPAREALLELCTWAQRIVLLGDVWELSFQAMETAVEASRPLMAALDERCAGAELVYLPGNHDHHFVARAADEHRERNALGGDDPDAVGPAARMLRRLCPNLHVRTEYPVWVDGDTLYHHGHYLSTHIDSPGWRAFDRLQWLVWHQERRENLTAVEYEALLSPLHELCYQVAQLPGGLNAQMRFERSILRLSTTLGLPVRVGRGMGSWAREMRSREREAVVRMAEMGAPNAPVIDAMHRVVENVAAGHQIRQVIFGHTHTPFVDGRSEQDDRRYHNCGSWMVDPRGLHRPGYWQRFAPATALTVEDGRVQLHGLLSEQQIRALTPSLVARPTRPRRHRVNVPRLRSV